MSVTIKDVARQANVSVATVSRALNGHPNVADDVRQRVPGANPGANFGLSRARDCAKCPVCLDGDVAEWLKAAVC